jgi:serine protease
MSYAAPGLANTPEVAVPHEVLLKLRPMEITKQSRYIRANLGLTWVRSVARLAWVVPVPPDQDPAAFIAALQSDPMVEYAEPNAIFRASATQDLDAPGDLYFGRQWNLKATNFGINAWAAWTVTKGENVNVAVLDTGCAYQDSYPYFAAPDLTLDLITPLGDWVNSDAHPNDDHGHGTFVCGVIAQATGNGIGGSGIAPLCRLMPAKVLDAYGVGRADWVASAIYSAANLGADVILIAANSRIHSRTVQDAIHQAVARGATVVCPAGNDGVNLDAHPGTVAHYANTLVVGATSSSGLRSRFSNYGSRIDLSAPGDDIWAQSLDPGAMSLDTPLAIQPNTIVYSSGTSYAAAHVAGVLALAFSVRRTVADVVQTARDMGLPGRDAEYGYGLVDAAAVVGSNANAPATDDSDSANQDPGSDDPSHWENSSGPTIPLTGYHLSVESYAPSNIDPTQGVTSNTFRQGAPIGVAVTLLNSGQPVRNASIHCIIRGATGAVLMDRELVPGADGRAAAWLMNYDRIGGVGIYTIEVTGTIGPVTVTNTAAVQVVARTRER